LFLNLTNQLFQQHTGSCVTGLFVVLRLFKAMYHLKQIEKTKRN